MIVLDNITGDNGITENVRNGGVKLIERYRRLTRGDDSRDAFICIFMSYV